MMMGKPSIEVFERFKSKYFKLCREAGLEQYLVPYLMSSHPGATMNDAVEMALWLKKWGYSPEQVQDFYPTPGTISTVMYYTGIDPMTGKAVNVTTDYREKQLQRALLQFSRPENANLVREALHRAGREDLIGYGEECIVRPAFGQGHMLDKPYKPVGKGGDGRRAQGSKSASHVKRKSSLENKHAPNMQRTAIEGKKSKLEKTFGADALRIRREADRMVTGKSTAKSAQKASQKSATKSAKKSATKPAKK